VLCCVVEGAVCSFLFFCRFGSESIVLLLLIAVVCVLWLVVLLLLVWLVFEAGKGVGVKAKGGESGSCFQLSCLHLFSVSFVLNVATSIFVSSLFRFCVFRLCVSFDFPCERQIVLFVCSMVFVEIFSVAYILCLFCLRVNHLS
jgi:hypothetical protein